MWSKVCILKTQLTKLKTKIKNIGRPVVYLFTRRAGQVIKVALCNLLPFQKVSLQKKQQVVIVHCTV